MISGTKYDDPQNWEIDEGHVCRCGALKKPDADLCPSCAADYADSLREMEEERKREEREAVEDDIRWCEDRGLHEMATMIRLGLEKGIL